MAKAKTILFADDDQVLLTSYSTTLLEKAGYHVVKAHDGLAAMKNLFLFVPDLLILDLMMP
jgi:DNA-binding response OmpR family regulator